MYFRRVPQLDLSPQDEKFVNSLFGTLWHYNEGKLRRLVDDVQRTVISHHVTEMLREIKGPTFRREVNPTLVWSTEMENLAVRLQPIADGQILPMLQAIGDQQPRWLAKPHQKRDQQILLEWFIRLWLFVDVKLDDYNQSLAQSIALRLPKKTVSKDEPYFLQDDLSAKSLTRIANIQILPTSDIGKHLTFHVSATRSLYIFRHAGLLDHLRGRPDNNLFPAEFLEETSRTLYLLYPYRKDPKTEKRVRKLQRRRVMDVEAQVNGLDLYDLSRYPYYRQRLLEVERRYSVARPKMPKQWWFDRRHRMEWTTLVIASIVFILTVVFGVIQSVTGILQVQASFSK